MLEGERGWPGVGGDEKGGGGRKVHPDKQPSLPLPACGGLPSSLPTPERCHPQNQRNTNPCGLARAAHCEPGTARRHLSVSLLPVLSWRRRSSYSKRQRPPSGHPEPQWPGRLTPTQNQGPRSSGPCTHRLLSGVRAAVSHLALPSPDPGQRGSQKWVHFHLKGTPPLHGE